MAVAVIEFGLLGAIAARAAARGFDDLGERRIDFDFGDVSALVWRGERFTVLREEGESGLVVVLAEEISFADGFGGEGGVEGKGGRDQEERCGKGRQ